MVLNRRINCQAMTRGSNSSDSRPPAPNLFPGLVDVQMLTSYLLLSFQLAVAGTGRGGGERLKLKMSVTLGLVMSETRCAADAVSNAVISRIVDCAL